MINRIAVLGTGLIGGSLGLAIKRARPEVTIVGLDDEEQLETAHGLGAIDEKAATLRDATVSADLVVIATPMPAILSLLEEIGAHAKPDALITDVGSVKLPIMEHAADVIPHGMTFVGGHPMAGAAAGGVEHADPLLFENAVYVLCPQTGGLPDAFAPVADLLQDIGARVLVMDAARHDRIAAAVSHLPQLAAVALVDAAYAVGDDDRGVPTLAAGGFRDMTRIADSPFETWRGILAANYGNVLDALSALSTSIQRIRNRLIEEDFDSVAELFETASRRRREIPRDMRGFLHPLYNIVVHAEDRPGWLAGITSLLASQEISIKDIELLKIREGTGGTFRIGFASAPEMRDALDVLRSAGYTVRTA